MPPPLPSKIAPPRARSTWPLRLPTAEGLGKPRRPPDGEGADRPARVRAALPEGDRSRRQRCAERLESNWPGSGDCLTQPLAFHPTCHVEQEPRVVSVPPHFRRERKAVAHLLLKALNCVTSELDGDSLVAQRPMARLHEIERHRPVEDGDGSALDGTQGDGWVVQDRVRHVRVGSGEFVEWSYVRPTSARTDLLRLGTDD